MMFDIALPWPPKTLSPNWTGKLKVRMRAKRHYRNLCQQVVMLSKRTICLPAPDVRLHLDLRFFPPARHHYDLDNLEARMKHGIDGVCKALGINDRLIRSNSASICRVVPDGQVDLLLRQAVVEPAVAPLPRHFDA